MGITWDDKKKFIKNFKKIMEVCNERDRSFGRSA